MDSADISWLCHIVSCSPGDSFTKNSSVRQIWTRGKTDICLDPLFTILLTSEIAEMWEVLQPSQDYLLWNISWDFDSQHAIFLVFVCICYRVCVRLFAEHLKITQDVQISASWGSHQVSLPNAPQWWDFSPLEYSWCQGRKLYIVSRCFKHPPLFKLL